MKIDVDYEMVLNATDKLEKGETLSEKEMKGIIAILRAVQGDYIPTKEELEIQKRNVKKLYEIDIDKSRSIYNRISDECREFENKYC